jgi:serine/arginine repetitive matrix protein 2
MSVLDAATKDLASLINRLDLEATPASRKDSPLKRSPISLRYSPSSASLGMPGEGSPCKTKFTFNKDIDAPLLPNITYPTTLKPRASLLPKKSLATVAPVTKTEDKNSAEHPKLIGKPIVPWSSLDWQVSPKKPTAKSSSTFRPSHKRTITPLPALDSPIALEPLGPSVKKRVSEIEARLSGTPLNIYPSTRPSSNTFGSSTIHKIGKQPSFEDEDDETPPPSPSPVVKKMRRHSRKASVLSAMCDSGVILPPEAMKSLGLMGTMGEQEPDVDPDDPDSDIPDELQSILSGQSDEEPLRDAPPYKCYSSPPLKPSPMLPIAKSQFVSASEEPVFRATIIDDEDHETDIDELTPNEDDTGNSFDFTGELRKLNVSGGSDRRSFVEQLENAFRTPVRVELGFSLAPDMFVKDAATPASAASFGHKDTPGEDIVPRSVTEADLSSLYESQEESHSFRDSSATDTLDHLIAECEADICRYYPIKALDEHSVRSQESNGKLNTSFKFGGQSSTTSDVSAESSFLSKPLTLSDIIPPLFHQPGLSDLSSEEDTSKLKSILGQLYEDDSSVVGSIMAEATHTFLPPRPQARPRLDSTASSKRLSQDLANLSKLSGHSRNASERSFAGLESYEEIRRAFEFGPNRPTFYPPPGAASRTYDKQRESFYSITSMSSYGAVLHSGKPDPFGYASSRPISEDLSMSMTMSSTVDDTFSFVKKSRRRSRVDSDTSSFYFQGLGSSLSRSSRHLHNESNFSGVSKAPHNGLHNRSFGARLRHDSNASMSSQTHSFVSEMSGLQGDRATWARHRQEPSSDSVMSKFSAARLGRPGLGDRMFDRDHSMPLSGSSGSLDESPFSDRYNECSPYDSVFDGEHCAPRSHDADSILEETDRRLSYSEDVFDLNLDHSDLQEGGYARLRQFRPISMISTTSTHSAPGEDDTMISVSIFNR